MKNPEISIIVPVYNVEKYLHRCIKSLLNQNLKDFELILVNDGSPDNCGSICDDYGRNDPRIKVIHQENRGVSAARNTGMEAAGGRFVGFIDPDDYIGPGHFKNMLLALRKYGEIDLAISGYTFTSGGREKKISYVREAVLNREDFVSNFFSLQRRNLLNLVTNKLYRADLVKNVRFEPKNTVGQDYFFNLSYFPLCKRFAMVPQCEYFYTIWETSVTTLSTKKYYIHHDLANSVPRREKIRALFIKNGIPEDDIKKHHDAQEPQWFFVTVRNAMAGGTPFDFRGQVKQIRKAMKFKKAGRRARIETEKGAVKIAMMLCYRITSPTMVWLFMKMFSLAMRGIRNSKKILVSKRRTNLK
ncbi:MAG TPA: glycosyltransferase [bacterium]|nr:glycosyltransferase [bacterium]